MIFIMFFIQHMEINIARRIRKRDDNWKRFQTIKLFNNKFRLKLFWWFICWLTAMSEKRRNTRGRNTWTVLILIPLSRYVGGPILTVLDASLLWERRRRYRLSTRGKCSTWGQLTLHPSFFGRWQSTRLALMNSYPIRSGESSFYPILSVDLNLPTSRLHVWWSSAILPFG
jgi:hypothetical protein